MIIEIIGVIILQNSIFDFRFVIISQVIIILRLLKCLISFKKLAVLCFSKFLLLLLLLILLILIEFNLR